MGVFSKLKGIFYDEVEVEDEEKDELEKVSKIVKKEPKVEIPKIEEVKYKTVSFDDTEDEEEEVKEEKTEEKADNTFDERDLFRSERTFNFVDFGDDEEEEKEVPKRNVLSEQNRPTNKFQDTASTPDAPKVFKPTPVISPIWGVLDKDYKKDEIQTKTLGTETLSSAVTSYDSVRRKAYGTLEDQLEDTINSTSVLSSEEIKKEAKKEEKKAEKELDEYEQKTAKIEDLISKIDEATNELDKTASIGELEDRVELENFEDEEEEPEEEENILDKTLTSSTLEHDLFNLIDSMYDDKEE